MTTTAPIYSETVRLNEIGAGLERTVAPAAADRARIARALDLQALDGFEAEMTLVPAHEGWTLSGRIVADAVQTCGLTLEPLPVAIDQRFSLSLVEAASIDSDAEAEVEVSLDDEAPDPVTDGKIDLGQYAVEQLALTLDPFPRKPGAAFVQPEEPAEQNPFAVLKAFKRPEDGGSDGDGRG